MEENLKKLSESLSYLSEDIKPSGISASRRSLPDDEDEDFGGEFKGSSSNSKTAPGCSSSGKLFAVCVASVFKT